MHPLDSSLDASVHDHRGGGGHRRPNYLGSTKIRRPRRTSLDNGVATTEELILLVTSSSKSLASMTRSNSLDTLDNSTDNLLLSAGQWYNYSSDDDMMEESDYFAASGYIKPKKQSNRGQRRLSLNNCTAMNMTFLANYNVSTADKSDLDVDCHNYFDENKTTGSSAGSGAGDAMSVGTRSSYQSNNDSVGGKPSPPHTVSDDDNYINENYDNDDDDDDLDSFGEAEDAEPADEEYIRKNLGASCIWNDDVAGEGLPPPPAVRRGGKKTTTSRKMTPHEDEVDMNMVLTNTSNNSNPIPNDSARTTSSCEEEFTVVNTHPIGTTIVQQKESSFLVYNTNDYDINDPFHQDDDDDGCDTMDIYHDETLDAAIDDVATPPSSDAPYPMDPYQVGSSGPINHLDDHHVDHGNDGDDDDDDDGVEDDYYNDGEDSDCDSFCDANDDDKADKDYMKRVLGASLYWNNSVEDLSFNNNPQHPDGPTLIPPPIKRSISKRSASGRSNANK